VNSSKNFRSRLVQGFTINALVAGIMVIFLQSVLSDVAMSLMKAELNLEK
jgi:hypothetical protein